MTAQDQQSRAKFEALAESLGYDTTDLGHGFCHADTRKAQKVWQAARALPAPENVREGEPYDNPAFEDLARTMGVWATAQAALCAQFFIAGRGALPAGMEPAYQVKVRGVFQDPAPLAAAFGLPDGTHDLYTAAQVLAMLAQGLAPGWQAVPLVATPEMLAEIELIDGYSLQALTVRYQALLAAAPRPPAAQADIGIPTSKENQQVAAQVDCIGLALELESQAQRVESQSVERAMAAAAQALRLLAVIGPLAPNTGAGSATAGAAPVYRLLRPGVDTIQATDEVLADDVVTWKAVGRGIFAGMTYIGAMLPVRRAHRTGP